MKCKFCNADQTKEFIPLASPHNRQIYILYECQKCLSRFFDIYQHNVSIKALYEEIATDNSNLSIGFSPSPYWEHQKTIALELYFVIAPFSLSLTIKIPAFICPNLSKSVSLEKTIQTRF